MHSGLMSIILLRMCHLCMPVGWFEFCAESMSLINKLIVNDLHLQLIYEDNSIMCETSHKLEHFPPLNSF